MMLYNSFDKNVILRNDTTTNGATTTNDFPLRRTMKTMKDLQLFSKSANKHVQQSPPIACYIVLIDFRL